MHHIWQSRSLGVHYGLQGIAASIRGRSLFEFIYEMNYFEAQAYGYHWFGDPIYNP
jgi:hypothetical protein